MPQAVFVGLGLLLENAAGAFLIVNSALLSSGALLLGGMAYSASKARAAKRKAREQLNAAQVDRLVNVSATTGPRELVLGRVRKGGNVFYRASSGSYNTTFVMCVALAGHEIDAVEQVWLNDQPVTLDVDGYVQNAPYLIASRASGSAIADGSGNATLPHTPIDGTVSAFTGSVAGPEGDIAQVAAYVSGATVTTAPGAHIDYQYWSYASRARIRAVLGNVDQLADARLVSLMPGVWTAAHRARAVAYLICEYTYDETAFPSGLPTVTATVRGARVFDPRTSTTAWSANPALLMRHVYTHPYFGKCASPSAAEDARISAAADACDTSHEYIIGGVSSTVALYRAGVVIPFGAAARDALDDLAQAMAGAWAFAGGELYVKAGVWVAPVLTLTEADLADVVRSGPDEQAIAINIAVHREQAQKFNSVNATIWDEAQGYKQVVLSPLIGNALRLRDGMMLAQSVEMPAIGFAAQALHVAGVLMRDARDPLTVTLTFKLRAYPVELFDTVALTIPHYGWSSKPFIVLGRDWTADGTLSLTLKETAQAIYTPDAEFLAQGYAENTHLPLPWFVPDLGVLTVTSGTDDLLRQSDGSIVSRMRVSWADVLDSSVRDGGSIEVQYRLAGTQDEWARVTVSGAETQAMLVGVQDSAWYLVRARARTGMAVGVWTQHVLHQVVGQTEPPPAFDRFIVLAQPDGTRQFNFGYTTTRAPVDWLGAQVRYISGSHVSPDWNAMTVLSDSQTYYTGSPFEVNVPSSGEWTFACRSMDSSGNLSPYRLHTITLPDRRLGSIYSEFDERVDGWTGTRTDCVVSDTGDLEAVDTTTWTTLPATWSSWTNWNFAPASPIVYVTDGRDLGATLTGQIDYTIDADGTTAVELATSADGTTWSVWGSSTAPFSARWVRLRITVTATVPAPVPLVRAFTWSIDAPVLEQYINDLNISTLTGAYRIGTGDVRVPVTIPITLLRRLQVTIQDSTAGTWTWALIDKTLTYGPRVQFRLGGTLTDPALVDFFIEGF